MNNHLYLKHEFEIINLLLIKFQSNEKLSIFYSYLQTLHLSLIDHIYVGTAL